jgi:DNA-binding protein H-NS
MSGGKQMTKINVDRLGYKELLDLQEEIAAAIVRRREDERSEMKKKIEELVAGSGFAVDEIIGKGRRGGRKGGATQVKYRNPKDASQTWTGRGRKPNWLVEALGKGQKLETFAVD